MKKLLFLLPLLLFGKEVTLDFINSKPASIAKDYYIWRFLNQNITSKEADAAFYQIKNVNKKLFLSYSKKSSDPFIKNAGICMKLKKSEVLDKDENCTAIWLTPYRFIKLSTDEQKKVLKKIEKFAFYKKYKILSSDYPFEMLLQNSDIFIDTFISVGDRYREEKLNKTVPVEVLNRLLKNRRFDSFVNISVTNPNLKKIHFSFFKLEPKKLSHHSSFLIGILAVKYNLYNIAKKFLIEAKKKAYYNFDIDKCNFWLYKITEDKKYLNELVNSSDINIYSIYAYELLNKTLDIGHWTLDIGNKKLKIWYVNNSKNLKVIPLINSSTNPLIHSSTQQNINNPFVWFNILNRIKMLKNEKLLEYAQNFKNKNCLPVYAFIIEKYFKYHLHPFITPYERILPKDEDKALVYAIARQESRFIPSSISRSFALGAFQIMPFLAKAIAKEKKIKDFDLDMMFEEKINLDFALHHLKFLKRKLDHPLLIAYAYNGGIGFLKRKVIDKKLFDNDPFLAMELIPYAESRKYGKKVLANYIVYSKIFKKDVKLTELIKRLTQFDRNHHF